MLNATYDGYLEFNNAKLKAATEKLYKAGKQLVSNYAKIGEILIEIKESELFKEDFQTFGEYTKEVLGISQATAYGMMSVCTRFLLPETKSKDTEPYFTRFADTALFSLLPLKMDYDETVEFCRNNDITEITPVADVKAIVKDYKNGVKAETESATNSGTESDESDSESAESSDNTNPTPRDIIVEALTTIQTNPAIYKAVKETADLKAFIQLYNGCLEYFKNK